MRTRPPLTIGMLAGALIGATLAALYAILLYAVRHQPPGIDMLLTGLMFAASLPLAFTWLRGMIELLTLQYTVTRNGLVISTLFVAHMIPHTAVREILPGHRVQVRMRGPRWPGFIHSKAHHPWLGELRILGTEPLERQIILVAEGVSYGISPRHAEEFLQSYARYRSLGPIESLPQADAPRTIAAWPIWRDRLFWGGIFVALLLNLALAGYALLAYNRLPPIIPMHWDISGQIDRLAPKEWIFWLPFIGEVTLLLNALLGILVSFHERFGARLLAWASIAVQASLWFAAWGILGL